MNIYRVEGPALLSVSGGRSSAFLLRHILDAHGGKLPDDVFPVFANTGEEAEGTLAFVQEMAERWATPIRWVEFAREANPAARLGAEYSHWREVTYCSASRKGEPFDAMVDWKQYLPNHDEKLCTEWLKVRAMMGFMASLGYTPARPTTKHAPYIPGDFDQVIGIRHDEPIRIANHAWKADVLLPLDVARVVRGDIGEFWAKQPFDLRIPMGEGNCRVCFEKGAEQLVNVIRDSPDGAGVDRFIARETRRGALMNKRRPYARLAARARGQLPLWEPPPEDVDFDLRPCMCGD